MKMHVMHEFKEHKPEAEKKISYFTNVLLLSVQMLFLPLTVIHCINYSYYCCSRKHFSVMEERSVLAYSFRGHGPSWWGRHGRIAQGTPSEA